MWTKETAGEGGRVRSARMSAEQRSAAAKKAALARWSSPDATKREAEVHVDAILAFIRQQGAEGGYHEKNLDRLREWIASLPD